LLNSLETFVRRTEAFVGGFSVFFSGSGGSAERALVGSRTPRGSAELALVGSGTLCGSADLTFVDSGTVLTG
jgi:hypothetical protein